VEKPEKEFLKRFVEWAAATKALYIVFAIVFALYLITKSAIFAILTALSLIALFAVDTLQSASKGGWKNEAKEIVIAVLVAAAIWYGGGFILHTGAPLDAVVSCSMLPNLERGDMVILQGGEPGAPEVSVSQAQFSAQDWRKEQVVCALCERPGGRMEPCAANVVMTPLGLKATGEANQTGNLLQYECGTCARSYFDGRSEQVPCTKAVLVGGQRVVKDYSADTVVYTPAQGDTFRGETIHRVYLKIDAGGKKYYFTRGDNNDQLDLQYGNSPIPEERVVGKVIARLPYVGYIKLFLFGMFGTPAGCDSVMGG